MELKVAILALVFVVTGLAALLYGYATIRADRGLTWVDAVRVAAVSAPGRISFPERVGTSTSTAVVAVKDRKARLRLIQLCGFGDLPVNFEVAGWRVLPTADGVCVRSVPHVEKGRVAFFTSGGFSGSVRELEVVPRRAVMKLYRDGEVVAVGVQENAMGGEHGG